MQAKMFFLSIFALVFVASDLIAGPIQTITEGDGPAERVVEYRLAPDAMNFRIGDTNVLAIANAIEAKQGAAATQAGLDTGLQIFGDGFGGTGVLGTLAENAGKITALKGINTVMTYAGLVFTGVQVANDLAQGKHKDAGVNSYKGVISFAISKYGWSALQTSATSLFIFDITLREVASGGRKIYQDRWREAMQRFFREDVSVARSPAQWQREIWKVYVKTAPSPGKERAPGTNPFHVALEEELDRYVAAATLEKVAFHDDPSRTAGGSSGLSGDILDDLREEHKQRLLAWVTVKIMPSIARRARERQLRLLVKQMNDDLVFKMNYPITLEVTAWNLPGATVRIPTKNGDDWGGPLSAQGTYKLDFTTFAWMKAGLPQVIYLDTAQGTTLSAALTVMGHRVVAIFGEPQTPVVTRMRLDEGERRCWLTRYTLTREVISSKGLRFTPSAPQILDSAIVSEGQMVVGLYDGETAKWTSASPAIPLYKTQLHLGEPRYNSLAIMENCNVSLFAANGTVMSGQCRFIRRRERVVRNEIRQMRCTSDGEISLTGVYADVGQGMQFHSMDGPVGKMLTQIAREGVKQGIPGMDPSDLSQPRQMVPAGPSTTEGN